MRKIYLALILALAAATALGISIGVYNMSMRNTDVTDVVVLKDNETHTAKAVHLDGMAPGEPMSYALALKADVGETYHVSMSFLGGQVVDLATYVYVRVSLGENIVGEMPLSDALDGKTIQFTTTFLTTDTSQLNIVYTMGEHVGNEAQGKSADLRVALLAEKQ